MKFPNNELINGLTRGEMKVIFESLDGKSREMAPNYYGGEIIAIGSDEMGRLCEQIEPLWTECLARFQRGESKFNEEAHFLSYLYDIMEYAAGTANPFIKRIWTGRKSNNACRSDFDLSIWHLPSEKKYGLHRLFGEVVRRHSRFWTTEPGSEFASYVSQFVGIPRTTLGKLTYEIYRRVTAPTRI